MYALRIPGTFELSRHISTFFLMRLCVRVRMQFFSGPWRMGDKACMWFITLELTIFYMIPYYEAEHTASELI